jgi:putative sugar O-methyltransferase
MREVAQGFSSVKEAIFFGQSRMGFDLRRAAADVKSFKPFEFLLGRDFPDLLHLVEGIGDSAFSHPSTLEWYRGRLVSNVHYFHLRYLLFGLTHAGRPDVVCEIGGGYGASARLWMDNQVHTPKQYIICDFPESLFFAEIFLRANFPEIDLLYVDGSEPLDPNRISAPSLVLCPIDKVGALSSLYIDLVINAASLQEMTEDWVDFWMDWLRDQNCRFFYSLNYFNYPLDDMNEGANSWSPRLSDDWVVRSQRFNPNTVVQHNGAGNAEIFAEKPSAKPQCDEASMRAQYEWTKSKHLDGQLLLDALDVIRLCPRVDVLWDLLLRCTTEMHMVPKESLYLAECIVEHADKTFLDEHGKQLSEIHARLREMRLSEANDMLLGDRITERESGR